MIAVRAHHALVLRIGRRRGAALVLVGGASWLAVARMPELKPWHEAELREEFTQASAGAASASAGRRRQVLLIALGTVTAMLISGHEH